MKKIDFKKVLEWLSFALRCPICGYQYNLETTKIIDTKQDDQTHATLLVHSDCNRCKSSVVFGVSIDGGEIFTAVMVTDLTSGDTKKFSNKDPLTTEDVHNVHRFLDSFDGNFAKVLGKA
jgi:hypothetical protein